MSLHAVFRSAPRFLHALCRQRSWPSPAMTAPWQPCASTRRGTRPCILAF